MQKYLLFVISIFVSCSQTFLEETQNMVRMNAEITYDTSENGILLNWETQRDFVEFEILRGSTPSTLVSYKKNVVQNTLLDEDTFAGQDYYYQINAYNSKKRQIGISDNLKGMKSYRAYRSVKTPLLPKASQNTYSDRVELIWVGNPQDRFRIYRSSIENGTYSRIAEVGFNSIEELKYIDTKVVPATSYFYKVASVGKDGIQIKEKYHLGSPAKGITLNAPTGVTASIKDNDMPGAIKVSWTEDNTVDYYQVYRSLTEDGTFELREDFVEGESYVDNDLPNMVGSNIAGVFTYPSYYYKIKSIKNAVTSGLSATAMGQAINPADFLIAPELNVALDKSVYPYKLNLSWEKLADNTVTYQVYKVDSVGTVSMLQNNLNEDTLQVPNDTFGTRWTYVLRPINNAVGGIIGSKSERDYNSTTPAPPIFPKNEEDVLIAITTNARTYHTNLQEGISKPMHVYYNGSGSGNYVAGNITMEWEITSIVGNINLNWLKGVASENVATYNIYRRKEGTTNFRLMYSNITAQTLVDTNFTAEEYQGTGTGDTFKSAAFEYTITAVFGGAESGYSDIIVGTVINPEDILPAPAYIHIPGHWAKGTGFGRAKWRVGANSPEGAILANGQGGVNHMYLVWGEVQGVGTYRVRHSQGIAQTGWVNNASFYPANKSNKARIQWFNNETSGTGLYVFGDFWGYSANAASFDVGSVNSTAGYLLGNVRGILFKEPNSNPFY